ncbi:ATP-binding protein [Fulvivirgaceae bacterium BMA10]|uniref:ATP-binding protein n=1 Tax=Splendidivirga corallicola TaxID=3051826 RepID=A0ABT8KUH7_9BACT|nr:ATP-binding protein [Fulvivirgaceae bacterium BMA10]
MNYHFKAPCSKKKLRSIREFISSNLKKHALADVEINMIVLAVDEVCANLIIHSHNCDPEETLELSMLIEDNKRVIFKIIDRGEGFNPLNHKEPSLEEIIQTKKKGGLGLILVKKIMDHIEFKSDSKKNVCILQKNIGI